MSNSPMIQLKNVSKSYDGRPILSDISLTVYPGEIVAIIGPSGCGKSTLLKLMSGLETPDTGTIDLADDNLTLVFQYSALFDSLTVFENVAFSYLESPDNPQKRKNRPNHSHAKLQEMVHEKLTLVGLDDVQDLYPNQLSGGMQKRVSFARAIMSDPKIIFYDEPTSGLDPIACTVIEDYIAALRTETKATSVVVTHQLSTIRRITDRVYLLFDGQVQYEGTADDFFRTANPFAQQFATATLTGPMAP